MCHNKLIRRWVTISSIERRHVDYDIREAVNRSIKVGDPIKQALALNDVITLTTAGSLSMEPITILNSILSL